MGVGFIAVSRSTHEQHHTPCRSGPGLVGSQAKPCPRSRRGEHSPADPHSLRGGQCIPFGFDRNDALDNTSKSRPSKRWCKNIVTALESLLRKSHVRRCVPLPTVAPPANRKKRFRQSPSCPRGTPSAGCVSGIGLRESLRRAVLSGVRTRALAVPCSACLWFLRYLGSVPLSEGYLWVLGFLMLLRSRG
jgi:hypothetical protein